jgi:hypothetical protein
MYDYLRPCVVSIHKLCGVINKSSLIDGSEQQDGAMRILYQTHTCNKIMQGNGHIHSNCINEDEYQYRYNCRRRIPDGFYLRGMDVYILLVQSTG